LFVHKHANYFIIALISACHTSQKIQILNAVGGDLYSICTSKYGIHPIQAILSVPLSPQEEAIFKANIQGKFISLSLVRWLLERIWHIHWYEAGTVHSALRRFHISGNFTKFYYALSDRKGTQRYKIFNL
jgi:hypothetical protein